LYSISNVCDQTLPVHTVVVVMLLTMSSNETEPKIEAVDHRSRNASSTLVSPPLLAVLHVGEADLPFEDAPASVGAGLQAEAVSVTVKSWMKVEHARVGDQVGDWVGLLVGDMVGLSVGLVVGDAVGDVGGLGVGQIGGAGQVPETAKGYRGPGAGCGAGGVVL
jgi:hypothetical protein